MSDHTFVEQCLEGTATLDEIDDFVEAWHEGDDPRDLHDYLGLTWEEYALFGERPEALRYIMFSRKHGVPVEDVLQEYSAGVEDLEPVAARAADPAEARAVLEWLKKKGRLHP